MSIEEDKEKRRIYDELIDLTCGTYSPGDLSSEQQQAAIALLRCRLSRYKTEEDAEEKYGPLLPLEVISQISKVPVEVVSIIVNELDLALPKEVVFKDGPSSESDAEIDDLLKKQEEQKKEKDLFNGAKARNAIDYLERILATMKSGKVHNISVIAINNDKKVSLWIPEDLTEDVIQRCYSPIVEFLSLGPYKKPN